MKIISIVGYKKIGKTTLIEKIVHNLKKHGSVGTVKHIHDHDLNEKNTDTWKHSEAGAQVVIAVTLSELVKFSGENNLERALEELSNEGMDFAVVEGFKDSRLPKIALGDVKADNIIKRLSDPENASMDEIVEMTMKQPDFHTMASLVRKVRSSSSIEKAGAIGTFTGIVRRVTGDIHTDYLEFEAHHDLARKKMDQICEQLKQRNGVIEVLMHHRTGTILPGEDIVYIAVAAGHRDELFPVLKEAIERLKEEVPIWKKEHTIKGDWWVHDA